MRLRLIPPDRDFGWTPYVFLLYLAFAFIQPVADNAGPWTWTITLVAVTIFLPLYFAGYWVGGRRGLLIVAGIAAIGAAVLPFNFGGLAFLIYAAAFLGFMFDPPDALKILFALLALYSIETYLLKFQLWAWTNGFIIVATIGLVNIYFGQQKRNRAKLRLAQAEVEHLAKVAERERIARDLHDVLGHTLSLIILKSELAGKLIERDIERARKEIGDVEQTARAALAEVRQAIGGYRTGTMREEFNRARSTLETAGVAVECNEEPVKLTAAQETVLALVTREAVTNVVRHAQARICRLRLRHDGQCASLEIHDDGLGGTQLEGNGIRGMRERIEALHGCLERDTAAGTRLTITLPLA